MTTVQRKRKKKADSPEADEREPGRGTELLSAAASKQVEENSEKIAKALYTATLAGKVQCTKLLLELSEGKKAHGGRKKARGASYAKALNEEPEWQESTCESEAPLKTQTQG